MMEKILKLHEVLDKETKKFIYNKARKMYLKQSICNIGKIVEEEDKIICYVEQKKLDRYKGKHRVHALMLNGMNTVNEESRKIVEGFKLDKPVYYVFENIDFKGAIKFSSRWSNVIFKNCIFEKNIGIIWADSLTFENNMYSDLFSGYYHGDCFFTGNQIKEITFINDNFVNSCPNHHPAKFGMNISCGTIKFINSKIDAEYPGKIIIKAKKTSIINSDINSSEIYIDSNSIDYSDSLIVANNGVMIENANCDFNGEIKSPVICYNGVDLSKKDDQDQDISIEESNLKTSRIVLIETLRKISNNCKYTNQDRIQKIKNNLEKQNIMKVLKRS